MKDTGIIRRIDDLGRIVIPMEIRKNLRIKEGENIGIYIEDDNIILKKYSPLKKITDITEILCKSLFSLLKNSIIVTDTTQYIEVEGKYKKELKNKSISDELQSFFKNRNITVANKIKLSNDIMIESNVLLNPILVNGDLYGLFIYISDDVITEKESSLISLTVKILAKYLEE